MKKLLLLIFTSACLVGCTPSPSEPGGIARIADASTSDTSCVGVAALARITNHRDDNIASTTPDGYGIFVNEHYVLTVSHVLEPLRSVLIRDVTGKEYRPKNIRLHDTADIALIRLSEQAGFSSFPALSGIVSLEPGTAISTIVEPTTQCSTYTGVSVGLPDSLFLQHTTLTLHPGMSGAPVFSASGDLIGINKAFLGPEKSQIVLLTPELVDRIFSHRD